MKKILIVDDNQPFVEFLDINLRKNGYAILKAYTGKETFEILTKERPDLILLDIILPDMNGINILRKIKSDKILSDIPVIFLSGVSQPSTKVEGLKIGADDYITKPFSMDELLARIELLLKRVGNILMPDISPTLGGDLSNVSLKDIIDIFLFERWTGKILLESDNNKGEMIFKDGNLISSKCEGVSGENAMDRMLKWHKGKFVIIKEEKSDKDLLVEELINDILKSIEGLLVVGVGGNLKKSITKKDSFSLPLGDMEKLINIIDDMVSTLGRYEYTKECIISTNIFTSFVKKMPNSNNFIWLLLDKNASIGEAFIYLKKIEASLFQILSD